MSDLVIYLVLFAMICAAIRFMPRRWPLVRNWPRFPKDWRSLIFEAEPQTLETLRGKGAPAFKTSRSQGILAGFKSRDTFESLTAKGVPVLPTTTTQETPEGTEYLVTWIDFAKLRLPDRTEFITMLTLTAVFCILGGWGAGSRIGSVGVLLVIVGIAAAVGALSVWLHTVRFEAARYIERSVLVRPDGSILLKNPPSDDANRETNAPPRMIADGLQQLLSVEYGKTADWHPLKKENVYAVGDWYDVYLVFDRGSRISVSRNAGSRDHAHQVATELNRLKAFLTRPKASRPNASGRKIN